MGRAKMLMDAKLSVCSLATRPSAPSNTARALVDLEKQDRRSVRHLQASKRHSSSDPDRDWHPQPLNLTTSLASAIKNEYADVS